MNQVIEGPLLATLKRPKPHLRTILNRRTSDQAGVAPDVAGLEGLLLGSSATDLQARRFT